MARGTADSVSHIPTEFSNDNPLRRDTVTVPACPSNAAGCVPSTQNPKSNQIGYTVLRFIPEYPTVSFFHVSNKYL